jgi:hypothetical protein
MKHTTAKYILNTSHDFFISDLYINRVYIDWVHKKKYKIHNMSSTAVTNVYPVRMNSSLSLAGPLYAGGTRTLVTLSQVGTVLVGVSGDFVPDMQGGVVTYNDGSTAFVSKYLNAFSMLSSNSLNKNQQSVSIVYGGTQLSESGLSSPTLNTTNLEVVNLSAVDVSASGNVTAGGSVTSATVNTADIQASGNVNVTGNLSIGGAVVVNSIATTGDITAGGNLSGQNITAVTGLTSPTITSTTSTTDTMNVNSLTTTSQLAVGAGGVTSAGTVTVNTGGVSVPIGDVSVPTGSVSALNITSTGTLNVTGAVSVSSIGGKGRIAVSNGTNLVGKPVGNFGAPVLYDASTSTGLTSTSPAFSSSTPTVSGFTGGTVNVSLLRTGRIATMTMSVFPQMTNTSGANSNLLYTLNFPSGFGISVTNTKYAIQIVINSTTQTGVLVIEKLSPTSFYVAVDRINIPGPGLALSFAPGDTVLMPQTCVSYVCDG